MTVARARKIQRFLSQPFHVAEVFTGSPGKRLLSAAPPPLLPRLLDALTFCVYRVSIPHHIAVIYVAPS